VKLKKGRRLYGGLFLGSTFTAGLKFDNIYYKMHIEEGQWISRSQSKTLLSTHARLWLWDVLRMELAILYLRKLTGLWEGVSAVFTNNMNFPASLAKLASSTHWAGSLPRG
jgi:hypothetical protein